MYSAGYFFGIKSKSVHNSVFEAISERFFAEIPFYIDAVKSPKKSSYIADTVITAKSLWLSPQALMFFLKAGPFLSGVSPLLRPFIHPLLSPHHRYSETNYHKVGQTGLHK